jgi:hypothetical protein
MSKLTKFLGNVVGGIFGSEGDMKDYKHAARLFTDNLSALSPKVEFLYHVYFDINPVAARTPGNFGFAKSEANIEVGMLVKSCQVPGVTINTETKNQYGKKTNIQTQVQYTPINMVFHDDNTNLISGMWQQYFKNYYADSNYPDKLARHPTYNAARHEGNGATTQLNQESTQVSFGYDDWATANFFNHISIYQLSRHRFFEYTLINPIITSWNGATLNSSSSQPAENQMQIIYEGIKYAEGDIKTGSPDGFAQLHYDSSPSPLSLMGGGSASLFGQTGVLAGGLDVFGDVASGQAFANPLNFIGTAIKAKNTYENAKKLTSQGIKQEVTGIAEGALVNTIGQTLRETSSAKTDQAQTTPVETNKVVVANNKDIIASSSEVAADTTSIDTSSANSIDPNTGQPTEFYNSTDYYAWKNAGRPATWAKGQGIPSTVPVT